MAFETIDLETLSSLTLTESEENRDCESAFNQTEHNDNELSVEKSSSLTEENRGCISTMRLNHEESDSPERGVLTFDENHQKWIRYRVIPSLVSDEEWNKAAVS